MRSLRLWGMRGIIGYVYSHLFLLPILSLTSPLFSIPNSLRYATKRNETLRHDTAHSVRHHPRRRPVPQTRVEQEAAQPHGRLRIHAV